MGEIRTCKRIQQCGMVDAGPEACTRPCGGDAGASIQSPRDSQGRKEQFI